MMRLLIIVIGILFITIANLLVAPTASADSQKAYEQTYQNNQSNQADAQNENAHALYTQIKQR